jgi:hypothetical protein
MNRLWPGSWIDGNYSTWIGEQEENTAWEYLLRARKDLESTGLKAPDPAGSPRRSKTKAWYAAKAWEAMYAAEGSDWFWWFGKDQSAPGGDKPYEAGFLTHLRNMYRFANEAGAHLTVPEFGPIIVDEPTAPVGGGTMARGSQEMQTILLRCDARGLSVPTAIYVAGSVPALGDWTPNLVAMHDDGTSGDEKAGDGIWSLQLDVPVGLELQYKYTNSGKRGEWIPSEEFSQRNRHLTIKAHSATPPIINDIYGK